MSEMKEPNLDTLAHWQKRNLERKYGVWWQEERIKDYTILKLKRKKMESTLKSIQIFEHLTSRADFLKTRCENCLTKRSTTKPILD